MKAGRFKAPIKSGCSLQQQLRLIIVTAPFFTHSDQLIIFLSLTRYCGGLRLFFIISFWPVGGESLASYHK